MNYYYYSNYWMSWTSNYCLKKNSNYKKNWSSNLSWNNLNYWSLKRTIDLTNYYYWTDLTMMNYLIY